MTDHRDGAQKIHAEGIGFIGLIIALLWACVFWWGIIEVGRMAVEAFWK